MKIGNDIYYVGVNDHQVDLFEGQYVGWRETGLFGSAAYGAGPRRKY